MKKPALSYYYSMLHGGYLAIEVFESGAEAIEDMRYDGNLFFPNAIGGRKHKSIPKNGELTIGFSHRHVGCRFLEPDEVEIMNDENLAWRTSDGHLVIHKQN